MELAEIPHRNCCTGLNGSSSCTRGNGINEGDEATAGHEDANFRLPTASGTWRTGTLAHESPTSQIAATLSECFVTRTRSVRGKLQRERYMQSFRQNGWRSRRTWLPALPPHVHVQRLAASCTWFLFQVIVIFVDIVCLFCFWEKRLCEIVWMPMLLGIVYAVDVNLRLYGLGLAVFCSKRRHIFETSLVVVTFAGTFAVWVTVCREQANQKAVDQGIRATFRVIWLIRTICCGLFTLIFRIAAAVRRLIGENKRRFVDGDRDFDLDLAYITPRLVGMSVPAQDCVTSLYRNPLRDVARFFETFHAERYLIVNACPELPYPTSDFVTGKVERFEVQDHMPPQLSQIVEFLRLGREWTELKKDRILAVHCRGGKGRTGVFCCAWLLYTREAEDAQDALNYFSVHRTDMHDRFQSKVQTVETPSQMRYVRYIEQMLRRQDCFFPAQILQPTPVLLQLHSVTARGMFRAPVSDRLRASVHTMAGGRQLYTSPLGTGHWRLGGIVVEGDVRVSIRKCPKSAMEPGGCGPQALRGEDRSAKTEGKSIDSLFHFVFHTAFVGESLQLEVPLIDKACKKPKLYRSSGVVELSFSRVT